ncbi:unnamed protein product [Closterium sp. NIES-64]|nr:unnamed protein product [Closterium sp. NIES-64]
MRPYFTPSPRFHCFSILTFPCNCLPTPTSTQLSLRPHSSVLSLPPSSSTPLRFPPFYLSSFSSSSPPSLYCSTTLTPQSPSPPTPARPTQPPQQRHAALFALTFLCDVSPPFAPSTLSPSSSPSLSPPPHRQPPAPLPHTPSAALLTPSSPAANQADWSEKNVLMSQAEADEHMAVKLQQQQQSDRFPAAQASVQPYSVHPQSFHLSPRPLARWRGREGGGGGGAGASGSSGGEVPGGARGEGLSGEWHGSLPALCLPLCPVVPAAAIVGGARCKHSSADHRFVGLVTASWYAPSEASTSSTEPTPINVDLVASSDSSVASTFSSSGDSAAAVAKSAKPAPPLVHAPPAPRAAATRIAPRACRRPLVLSAYDGVLDPELFETTGELGRGGFGTVVAVKRVERKQLVAASNEAMLSASLSECPGVLGVREVHLGEQHAYMLSDLCSGGDLRALMQRRKAAASNGAGDAGRGNGRRWWGKASGEGGRGGGMAEAEALEVVKHVGDAVAFCHERGVVHCDVKPDNILLATPTPLSAPLTVPLPFSAAAAPAAPARAPPAALGLSAPVSSARTSPRLAAGAVRLADFGLAQVVAEGQRGCSTPAGTPGYMAPEVEALCRPRCPPAPGAAKHARKAAGGAEAGNSEAAGYGRAADVWSLGVTLYEMIAGERPYSGGGASAGRVAGACGGRCVGGRVGGVPRAGERHAESARGGEAHHGARVPPPRHDPRPRGQRGEQQGEEQEWEVVPNGTRGVVKTPRCLPSLAPSAESNDGRAGTCLADWKTGKEGGAIQNLALQRLHDPGVQREGESG